MVWLALLVAVFGSAILATHIALAAGVIRNRARDLRASQVPVGPTRATVLVVSKDEEEVLPDLLASLERQTAPSFDVVLVDDRSTDRTGAIMEEFCRSTRRPVVVLRNDREPVGVTGKVQALDLAVAAASGDIFLFTDSDCVLPEAWVAGHLSFYRDPRVGAVFGQVDMRRTGRFQAAFQSFDQRLIHQYSCGSAGWGIPTGCFGNNLSARRAALAAVGGFRGLGYTLTEDAALIAALGRRWRIVASTHPETTVLTRPLPGWRAFINQHTRWNIGGFYSADRSTRMSYRFLVLYLTASVLIAPAALLLPVLGLPALVALGSVGLLALIESLVYPVRRVGDRFLALPLTAVFLVFYSYITIRAILRRRPVWKGAVLDAG
jgi:cellulose synthase/poly-beta-1,6-N-acetylglucosamine synthase-like glycosyltransferase